MIDYTESKGIVEKKITVPDVLILNGPWQL